MARWEPDMHSQSQSQVVHACHTSCVSGREFEFFWKAYRFETFYSDCASLGKFGFGGSGESGGSGGSGESQGSEGSGESGGSGGSGFL